MELYVCFKSHNRHRPVCLKCFCCSNKSFKRRVSQHQQKHTVKCEKVKCRDGWNGFRESSIFHIPRIRDQDKVLVFLCWYLHSDSTRGVWLVGRKKSWIKVKSVCRMCLLWIVSSEKRNRGSWGYFAPFQLTENDLCFAVYQLRSWKMVAGFRAQIDTWLVGKIS